jgi:DNA-binding SARP family transcriptional activator/tetratricopeptide (TPR) repeat protein
MAQESRGTGRPPGAQRGLLGRVANSVDLRLLGSFQVVDGAGTVLEIPGARPRALLALLSLHSPDVVSTDRILEELWGREDVKNPEAALHVAVSRLRGVLGEGVVETVPGGYRLDIPATNSDAARFRRHTQRGRQFYTLGHPGKAAESFRQALAQWRGDPLVGLRKFEFAEQAARQLEEERLSTVEALMDAELAAGEHELVIGELSGLVEAFPLRERLWGQLMLSLYRSGRQAEALRTFTRVKEILGEELGIEPSRELTDLEERILLHDPTLDEHLETTAEEWAAQPELLSFASGEVIVTEGAPANTVYWIEDGQVEVVREDDEGEHVLTTLGPGRYFGELASLLATGRTASVRAATPVTVSLHSVDSFRSRLGAERAKEASEPTSPEAVRELIDRAQYLHAYDLAARLIESGSSGPEIRWLAVLALARSGATSQARRRFEQYGLASIDPGSVPPRLAEDIAALAARLDKDMAFSTTGDDRQAWAQRSATRYQAAFDRMKASYLAVNAATMWLVAGHRDKAKAAAQSALDELGPADKLSSQDRYWHAATEAEAALVLGDTTRAAEAIVRAARVSEGQHAQRAITRHQLNIVCGLLDFDPAISDPIANPAVVHFCGHRILPEGSSGRFSPEEEPGVAQELKETFERLGVGVGYGSLAAGADILAAEALLERGAELHVVLPFPRDEFIRTSVAPAGPEWVNRFERCLAGADRVVTAVNSEYLDDPVLFDFCSQIAMGNTLMRARFLETTAHQVAVWDGIPTGGSAGTAVDIAHWQATGRPSTVISVGTDPQPKGTPPAKPVRRIRGIVFADFAGFSTLSDAQLVTFQDLVMGGLASAMEPYQPQLLSGRTWGDGLYLVFDDVASAAECALAVQDTIGALDFEGMGLHGLRGIRIAAHATPVFDGWDPIAGTRLFYGSGVTQTARIEPRTPEGEIYTTQPFAALATLRADRSFDTQYVGTMPTAKNYGEFPLFALRRRT